MHTCARTHTWALFSDVIGMKKTHQKEMKIIKGTIAVKGLRAGAGTWIREGQGWTRPNG